MSSVGGSSGWTERDAEESEAPLDFKSQYFFILFFEQQWKTGPKHLMRLFC